MRQPAPIAPSQSSEFVVSYRVTRKGTAMPRKTRWIFALLLSSLALGAWAEPIDRHALVTRHNVTLTNANEHQTLQVGNGEFAFGVDVTGLQSIYGNTLSHWGWHSFPLPAGQKVEDFQLQDYDTHGRLVGYATSGKGQDKLFAWLRENPHCFNLGRLRLLLDGQPVTLHAVRHIRQELDLWRGVITSRYELAGQPVRVETGCHPTLGAVAVRIESPLLAAGRLAVELAFPYGSPGKDGADWAKPEAHTTTLTLGAKQADFARQLDADKYAVRLAWAGTCELKTATPHTFTLQPDRAAGALEFVCGFAAAPFAGDFPSPGKVFDASARHWQDFWSTGGALDLSGSKDPRWFELERRVVLSQYLLAVNEAGSLPPQESGLVNNGWNGKFHLEMHWWHGAHYALWGRWPLFERSLEWYRQTLPSARLRAQTQGYRGARWPKMVGPDGHDAPSAVGPLLIWQQPHPIFYAELDYRLHPTQATLEKWSEVVNDTADFLASYAYCDSAAEKYVLGPPLKTVPENTDPLTSCNPAFELSYWRYGLRSAQQWRERLGLSPDAAWNKVLTGLAPLPQQEGVYLQQEGMTNTYTKWNWEHPSLVGQLGMLPGDGVDPVVMKATVRKVMAEWKWDRCWGWDFPMMAMAAARNGEPATAIDALLHPSKKNDFNAAGLSTGGPFPYFPSNGGLLYAVALMAAGWDPAPSPDSAATNSVPQRYAPGFPADGSWTVHWEGLMPAL